MCSMIGEPTNFQMVCGECEMEYCFNCGEVWHPAVTCDVFREEALKTGKVRTLTLLPIFPLLR
jgi:IBR domain, a half RING-finger domain